MIWKEESSGKLIEAARVAACSEMDREIQAILQLDHHVPYALRFRWAQSLKRHIEALKSETWFEVDNAFTPPDARVAQVRDF